MCRQELLHNILIINYFGIQVAKEDISVRFFEEIDGQLVWEGIGDFQHTNVHKQVAISFRAPRYKTLEINQPVKCFIQLKRPSDGATSESLPFDFIPLDSGKNSFWSLRNNIFEKKHNLEIFDSLLLKNNNLSSTNDEEIECKENEVIDLDTPTNENISIENSNFIIEDENNTNYLLEEDKTLDKFLEQVAELDEIYTDHQIIKDEISIVDGPMKTLPTEESMEIDERSIYSSLQKAFKNPIDMIDLLEDNVHQMNNNISIYDAVEPPSAPVIIPISQKRESEEREKLPPLPPKRVKKSIETNDVIENKPKVNVESKSTSIDDVEYGKQMFSKKTRPASQIILMKSPEHPPYETRISTSQQNVHSPTKQKKQGFFSKIFRRKSKQNLTVDTTQSKDDVENAEVTDVDVDLFNENGVSRGSFRSLKSNPNAKKKFSKPVGRSVSSVSGKRPNVTPDVVHIPLKMANSSNSVAFNKGSFLALPNKGLSSDERKTMSALQLADLPMQNGDMELIAITDAQSLKDLCEGEYGFGLDPSVDLTEAEHYALYTTVAPHATNTEFDDQSCYYSPIDSGNVISSKKLTNTST